ncbi:RNA polymerase sigma-70 factor, ECF subfamily [Chitinophaga sp. CF118]|uniref:RNA polymerase sigma factor n=1 Tax=Chitinophaga sp. CF118 TaxID=1884367 RepID=UPI0008ECE2E0|nr:sigma-70 family RNA polymerase sigma factor [Chitinophaga sp. CF118]SFD15938.1 RNA polymerase sigma-70 factor, ECF subfamily [Chitinophaga sp. CF118]
MPSYFCKKAFLFVMEEKELLPHLFRTEYQKIVSVLCYLFGIEHIEVAEDIVSDTFLSATESWSVRGAPDNPTAWLYTVAKNKTKNWLKRNSFFQQKLLADLHHSMPQGEEIEIDLSAQNITDSQLAMIFTVCHPSIPSESQVALALNLLCGFGVQEIADAYLTNKEVIYKRISRAKDKLKETNIKIQQPTLAEINDRMETVLKTLYLLFSEGYYSASSNTVLRKEFCIEAMRLNYLLAEHPHTNKPAVNALLALMCFHTSRFDARLNDTGEMVLYQDQDETLWNRELIERGEYYLNEAAATSTLTKYHLEAAIAYWHTHKEDSGEKWDNILDLYNHLLVLEYSPIAALNRTFALAKVKGKQQAINEAEKLGLTGNYFYYSLLGNLYTDIDDEKALQHYEAALKLVNSTADRILMTKHIDQLKYKLSS